MSATIIKQNSAEGGTSGATVTTANSGGSSGDAFNVVSIGSGNTFIFDNTWALEGSLSYKLTQAGANQNIHGWTWTGAQSDFAVRFPFRVDALPTAACSLIRVYSDAGYATQIGSVQLTSTGKIQVTDTASATTVTDNSHIMSAATDYVLQVRWIGGTSLTATVYPKGSTTAFATATVTASAGSVNSMRWGITTASSLATLRVDDLAIGYGGVIDRTDVTAPPTASFTHSESALTTSVNGTGSTAVSPSTITGYDWDWGDGSTHGTGSTASHTYAAAGTYTVTLTVTDSNTLTGTATHSVTVAAPSGTASVQAVTASTGWTPSTGTALSCVTDGDPTTFVTSGTDPSGLEFDFTLGALTPPATGQPLKVILAIDSLSATTATLNAQLFEGTTQRSSVTGVAIPAGSGPSVTSTVALTFPWTDVQNITTGGWNALKVKLQVTAS